MRIFVENKHANRQINLISDLAREGRSNEEIAQHLTEHSELNLRTGSVAWTSQDIEQIRTSFKLNSTPPPLPCPYDSSSTTRKDKPEVRISQAPPPANAINVEKYREYTKGKDWNAICVLNGVELDSFGTKKELKVLAEFLENDEIVFALTSGIMKQSATSNPSDSGLNTWLVVLTSERFLFLDHALLTSSVDTQSIRHDHVQAVSASQGWVFGKIIIDIGSRMIVVDNCQKSTVRVIADLANKWLKELGKGRAGMPKQGSDSAQESPLDQLRKLAELRDMGALSDDEFSDLKKKVLSSL